MRTKSQAIIFLVLLVSCIGPCIAQLSVKGGVAVSGFKLSYDDASSSREIDFRPFLGYEVGWVQYGISQPDISFQLGISYAGRLSAHFALQSELYYAQRGYRFEQMELNNTSYRLKVHYLQIPVLLKYTLFPDWAVRPGLLVGPYVSFRTSANRTIDIWGVRNTMSVPAVNSLDYGIIFAIDAEFSAWTQKFGSEIRLDLGLASVLSQPKEYTALTDDPGTVRVLALSIMFGYRF